MDSHQIAEGLNQLLSNPLVQTLLVGLLVGLIPQGVAQKIPLLGTVLRLTRQLIERLNAENQARQINAGSIIAGEVVQGLEQLKTQGKLDSPSAAAQAQAELVKRTGLAPELSRVLVEGAVKNMNDAAASGVKTLRGISLR